MLNEGSGLSIKTRTSVFLQQAINRAESWKEKVGMVVPSYGKARSCSRHQLEQLLVEAKVCSAVDDYIVHGYDVETLCSYLFSTY